MPNWKITPRRFSLIEAGMSKGEVLVILVSYLRLLVFMGRVYYLVYRLGPGPAGPRNVSAYALNRIATCEMKNHEDQNNGENDFFQHLFRLHKKYISVKPDYLYIGIRRLISIPEK
jgi:hypothetical protein